MTGRAAKSTRSNACIMAIFAFSFAIMLQALDTASPSIIVALGNDPVFDPGWPSGTLKVANSKQRIAWWQGPPFGGGEWHFLYRGTAETFLGFMQAFAGIGSQIRDLVIHDGPYVDPAINGFRPGLDARVDWTMTVWEPEKWNHSHRSQPIPPPRMDVYVGGGLLDWNDVHVPAGIRIPTMSSTDAPVLTPTFCVATIIWSPHWPGFVSFPFTLSHEARGAVFSTFHDFFRVTQHLQ
jgi:hypothetical protein